MERRKILSVINFAIISIWSIGLISAAEKIVVKSPDNKTEVTITLDNYVSYTITQSGQIILDQSKIGMQLSNNVMLGNNPKLVSKKERLIKESIKSPFYRTNSFSIECKEVNLKFKDNFGILFRVYNEGVAYRFYTTFKDKINIQSELAEFNFDKDYTVYMAHSTNKKDPYASAFQNVYTKTRLSEADHLQAYLPATVDLKEGKKITILEADLEAYPGMYVQADQTSKGLKGDFTHLPNKTEYNAWRHQKYVTERGTYIANTSGTRSFPWRILAISQKDTEMPVNNLVYTLASPNRIGDYSWVKPGKVSWEWWNDWGLSNVDFKAGINMDTYKHYIDFASKFGLEYVVLDEGWYNPAKGDMMTVIPELDLPELVSYAKSKGVGIVLWTVFNVLDEQLEEACKYYSQLGIKGFKIDFLDRDDQEAVEMTYRIAEMTARYKLFLDLHGFYKPTGLNRTYPHIINFEGVFGMEEAKWSTIEKNMPEYDVTFPFIRMMAGPVDFTPGAMRNATKKDFQPIYYNPMSQGTRCHQLATYIVYDSPFTMLCDAPTLYEKEDEYTRFIASLPVETDRTLVLSGEMGEYIVTARQRDDKWHVGGLTNWTARSIQVDFSFLEDGVNYTATLLKDGINAEKQASDYSKETFTVNKGNKLDIKLASGGGFAIRIIPEVTGEETPKAVPEALTLDPFYKKYLEADGIAIVSSEKVSDEALVRARNVVKQVLSKRKDVRDQMVTKGCKVMIVGSTEEVCDIPEYKHICNTPENTAYWNKRARGFGGAPEHDFSTSCGEENVIGLSTDKYRGESILVHELAHVIHMIGIVGINPDFNNKLESLYNKAKAKGLWKNTYAMENKEEYFAETVQSFFNCNSYSAQPNGVHNSINSRSKLKKYDPEMYKLLLQYFPEDIELELCSDNKLMQGI